MSIYVHCTTSELKTNLIPNTSNTSSQTSRPHHNNTAAVRVATTLHCTRTWNNQTLHHDTDLQDYIIGHNFVK